MGSTSPTVGHFTFGFLAAPADLSTLQFVGIVFVLLIVMVAWAHHINDIS